MLGSQLPQVQSPLAPSIIQARLFFKKLLRVFDCTDFKAGCSISELQRTGLRTVLLIRYNQTCCRLNALAKLSLQLQVFSASH